MATTSTTTITNPGIRTSFANTPQAGDDHYLLDEAGLQTGAYSGVSYNDTTHILTLDVMSNDLGGAAKALFAIDDGNGHTSVIDYDLLTKDNAGVWETSANGNRIQIADGKINVDISQYLQSVGVGGIDALGAGDRIQDEFVYSIRLANGTLSQAKVTIDIQGSNDLASILGNHAGSVTEDVQLSASGALVVNDADRGESHAQGASGSTALGSYSVDADGQWSYTVDNAAVQHLAAGQSAADSFEVKSADGSASQTVSITINGTNDVASITGDASGALGEDDTTSVTGVLAVSDIDDGEAHAAVAAGGTALGSYTVDAEGTWSYSVNNDAVQHLAAGAIITDAFEVKSADGTATQTVTITVNGANDQAAISGDATGTLGEDDTSPITGVLAVTDVDDGEAHTLAAGGSTALGNYSVDTDGHWSYNVNTTAVQSLGAGQTATDSFTVKSLDGTAAQTISITINGSDDGLPHVSPVAHDDAWIVSQSTPAVMPLAALFGNDFQSDGASFSLTALSADGIHWTGTSGTTSYGAAVSLNASGITLNEGNRTGTDGFWYQASDGEGGTATGHVSIAIVEVQNGANGADTVNLSARSYDYAYIDAGEGNDTETGGSGMDTLVGGSGADVLTGNGGADILTGGTGNDVFTYSALADRTDTITDFQINKANGNDMLNVHDLLSSFSGIDATHSNAYTGGYLQLSQVVNGGGTDTQVWVDADGSSGSAAQVLLATLTNVALTQYDTNNIVL